MPGREEWAQLHLGEQTVPVRLRRTRRRTLGLYLLPDGRVELRVPPEATRAQALEFARARADWLRRRLQDLPEPPPAPVHEDGACHPYLGAPVTLCVRPGARRRACLQADRLWLRVRAPEDSTAVEAALRAWYRARAHGVFRERLAHWYPALGLPLERMPGLRIRAMRSRWGSCSSRGSINLNLWLIRAPMECIDYVVVHELCHLLELNHGPRFYAHMERILPDWRARRDSLRAHQRRWG